MWIYTTKGFLSVVQHVEIPESFQIRARDSDSLAHFWPEEAIRVIDWADYRYRITIPKSEALPVLLEAISSIDYTSFKDACGASGEYHEALGKVWWLMREYQKDVEGGR